MTKGNQRLLIEEVRKETALNLIKMGGLSENQISQATGLSVEMIRGLKL